MNLALFIHSLLLAVLATLLALALGWAAALAALGCGRVGRAAWLGLAVSTAVLPPFVVANGWLQLSSAMGYPLERLVGVTREAAGAVALAALTAVPLGLMLWPVAFLGVLGAWQRLEREAFEVDPLLVGGRLVRHLLGPASGLGLAPAALITAVLALNQFTLPALFQLKVLPVEVWMALNTQLDFRAALACSAPLGLVALLLLGFLHRRGIPWPRVRGTVESTVVRRALGRGGWLTAAAIGSVAAAGSVGLPLAGLLWEGRTWAEMGPALAAGRDALGRSVGLAAGVASGVVALGWGLAGRRWAWLSWLGFLLPGVLVGLLLTWTFNRRGWAVIADGFAIVVLAWGLRHLGLGVAAAARARASCDPGLVDAARLEGASGWTLWRVALWPQVAPQLAAAWYLVYLLCLWEVETLLMVVPPGGETAALRVFNFLHYGHNPQVNALCLWLLAAGLLPLGVWLGARSLRPSAARAGAWIGGFGLAGALSGCAPADPRSAALDSRIFERVQVIGERGAGLGQFNKPRSVALDPQDNLYVVDMTGRVQKFSADGAYLGYWQMPETDLGKPKGMCRDEQGHIVILEPHYGRVNHFDSAGHRVAQWGRSGTNAGELSLPRAVAIAPDGRAWVSEYGRVDRLQLFSAGDRRLLRVVGSAGSAPGQFQRPEGMALDAAGRLYVADSCNHRVQVLDPEMRLLRVLGRAGAGPGEMSYPYDVQVDSAGRIYVCEFGNSRIQVFDPEGRWVESLGGAGGAPGQLNNPWSLALDSRGNLYVADAMNHRVQKFVRRASPPAQDPKASPPRVQAS